MKRLTCILLCAAALSRAGAGNYQNFGVAIYIPVQIVRTFADPKVLESQWEMISSQVKVDKVYIEVHRDRLLADEKLLEDVKKFFTDRGVQVAGGSAFSDNVSDQYTSFCYTDPADREFVRKTSELAARHFDEYILDDFFFVTTKRDSDIAAKGARSWTDFRLDLMDEAGASLVVKAAKDVNPKIKVVIKFPNWYEHFQGLGFDLDREPRIFDGIYTGTETRDPVYTDQFLQQYESYQIIRYFENVKPGGNGGGWVDTYGVRYVDRYAEQLWDTMFAKAREITLFNWALLLWPAHAGDRKEWEYLPTSLNFNAVAKDYSPAGWAAPATPSWGTIAGVSLRRVDAVVGKLGKPIGIKSYKPYQSTGEDFLHNYIGMIGIPIDLFPEFPTDAKLVLLTESAKFDPDIVAKMKKQLEDGKSVVITSGLLRALKGKGIEGICEAEVSDSRVLASDYSTGMGSGNRTDLGTGERKQPILFPEVRFLTNDAWGLVSALENGNGYPIMLVDRYAKGSLYVWAIPDNFRNLYALPADVTTAIRDVLMKDFFVRIDGPSQVSLFAYDNNTFVAESFLPGPATVRVTVEGEYSTLRNLETGELIASYIPEVPRSPWRRRAPEESRKSHFLVPLMPHSYAAFAAEK
ncbi:MAG TPA: hypothetical protein VN775_05615 [Opitutaceae bacterium]|nr:hypothetical protein [Opitutaceae bacterium]